MNQMFNFQRWNLLIAKHWADNRKRYSLSIIAFVGLLLVWFLFVAISDPVDPFAPGLQQVTYFFSLFLVGPFYASQYFRDLGSRPKGINYLLTPASVFEKFLCGWLYALVLFFVVFTALFYLVDVIVVSLANMFHASYVTPADGVIAKKAEVVNVFTMGGDREPVSLYLLLIYMAVQSAALLGSVYFSQYSYIKTAITICLLFILLYIIESWFSRNLMPQGVIRNEFTFYQVKVDEDTSKLVTLPKWVGTIIGVLLQFGFPPIFWASTYFRLKEKEV